jgi:hypothetical protein
MQMPKHAHSHHQKDFVADLCAGKVHLPPGLPFAIPDLFGAVTHAFKEAQSAGCTSDKLGPFVWPFISYVGTNGPDSIDEATAAMIAKVKAGLPPAPAQI